MFNHRERKKQLISFEGLENGLMHPTDVDAFIEYKNKARILIELKYKDAPIPDGQRWALMNANDDFETAGKLGAVIIARHEVDDPKEDVRLKDCIVDMIYTRREWFRPARMETVQQRVNFIIQELGGEKWQ